MYRLFVLAAALLSLFVAGIAPAAAQDASPMADESELAGLGLPELSFRMTASALDTSTSKVPAGLVLLTVENAGEGSGDSVDLVRLPEGLTIDEAMAQAATPTASLFPDWVWDATWSGGPILDPGQTAQAVVDLSPGDWYAVSAGFTRPPVPITVKGGANATPSASTEPEATVDVTMQDFAFVMPEQIAAGPQVWRVDNAGPQPHLMIVDRVPDGTTFDQVISSLQSLMKGGTPAAGGLTEQDFQGVGGLEASSVGQTAWTELNLEPGTYTALCFMPDKDTAQPHALLGMVTVFTVA
jgi:hypothetical protein